MLGTVLVVVFLLAGFVPYVASSPSPQHTPPSTRGALDAGWARHVCELCATLFPLLANPPPFILGLSLFNRRHGNPRPRLPQVLASLALLEGMELLEDEGEGPARAEQGGSRITMRWLNALSQRECIWRFRFTASEILHLVDVLDIGPDDWITATGHRFTAVEALALTLARMRFSGDIYELVSRYDRCQAAISEIVNEVVMYLDDRWAHLLGFDHDHLLSPRALKRYADAVHASGAPCPSIWGFLDCTIRHMSRPSRWQRQAYNGYKKKHALKFQAVMLPNGMIGHLYGPFEGRRNDNALLAESGLVELCRQHAVQEGSDENTPLPERYFQLFGDSAYGLSPQLMSLYSGPGERTKDELDWNAEMSGVRIEVEHGFGIVSSLWPLLNAWWKLRVYSSPIGSYYRVGVLFTNALNALRPNQVSHYFNCDPPTLEEYFHD